MNSLRIKTVVCIAAISVMAISCAPKPEVTGVYVSKIPTALEQLKMAYVNNDFRFLYTREGDEVLKMEKDSSFSYQRTYCKRGDVVSTGKWKVTDDMVVLHFEGAIYKKDIEFNMLDKQLILVEDVVLSETKKHINSLTLLQRQK